MNKSFTIFIKIIVIILVGSKCDLFGSEEVEELEARNYAKEIGAFYQLASSVTGFGIKEIFNKIGCKLIDPNYIEKDEISNDNENEKSNEMEKIKGKNKNKDNDPSNNRKEITRFSKGKSNSIILNKKKLKEHNKKKKCC